MTPAPLRVGLIGFGYAGRTFHAPLIGATDGLALVAVGSRRPDDVHAVLPDVEVMADPLALVARADLDLVVIAAPNASHAPLATAALEAGRHVVVDKPFTLDLAEARALIALAARRDRLLSVFHNRRWDSDFLSIRAAIEAGRIGPVAHFESHFDRFRPQVRDRWREAAGAGGGIWYDLGPHLVDQALCLFGLPDRVKADFARQRDGAVADDWAHVVLHYGERRVVLHAGMLVAGGTARFTAHGPLGSLAKRRADRQEAQLLEGKVPGSPDWGADPDPLIYHHADGSETAIAAIDGDQRRYYAGVGDALRGTAANPVRPVEALAVMAVIEAAIASVQAHAAMPIALDPAERAAFAQP